MAFVLRMVVREMRAAWRRLIFFFLCLSIGVGAIVTLRSVIGEVRATLTREARQVLGADVTVSTNRPWDAALIASIHAQIATVPVAQRIEELETLTMVRPADPAKAVARLVELRGVQAGYPLYGTLGLRGGEAFTHGLLAGRGALVRPELLAQLDLRVGDAILIGEQVFTIRGVVEAEPGRRAGGFSFGTRVFIDHADLKASGLISLGSRASYRIQLRLADDGADRLARRLRQAFTGQFVSVRSFRSTENNISEDLQRTEDYLSLVGLVILVLGGIGVWSVVRVFVQQKLRSIAVLKCVGATSRSVLGIYVTQVLVMGFIGSLVGLLLAAGALVWLQPIIAGATGVSTAVTLSPGAVGQGVGIGVLVSLLFSVVPLLDLRHVRPSLLLRGAPERPHGRDWLRIGVTAVVGAALIGLAAWQAGSLAVGAVLAAGFAAVVLLLFGAAWAVVRAMAPLQHSRWFPVRYAARRVGRPGNQTRAILLAVGLGAFLVVGVRALQADLLDAFRLEMRPDTPDMFLIDVQGDQRAAVEEYLSRPTSLVRGRPAPIPVLRARVTGVEGREVNLERYEDVRGRGSLGREYVITYRHELARNESVVRGSFWPPTASADAEVSIEESLRTRFRIDVGDRVRFDVLGRVIDARVTSVRHVNWSDAAVGGFMFVFRPGALDAAPHTFIVPLRGPASAADRARLQRDLTAAFPNVSAVDVQEILTNVAVVVGNITTAVTAVGGLVLFSGTLILIGAVSMTKFQRVYEAAVLKTVGATTRFIGTILVIEYGLLGFVAGTVGSTGALALSWAVSRFALDLAWTPRPGYALAGLAGSVVLVATVGLLASLDVLRRKPLGTLRAE